MSTSRPLIKTLATWTGLCLLALSPAAAQFEERRLADDTRVNDELASTQGRPEVSAFDGGWVAVWESREGVADLEIRAQIKTGLWVSDDILVNDSSLGTQSGPAVGTDAQGNFVVVWSSNEPAEFGGDGSGWGIAARLFQADGTPRGASFQVNDFTAGHQMHPRVAMAADGSFIVTWRSNGSFGTDDSGSSVQARLFDANATPIGLEFQVNDYTTFNQAYPDVAISTDGSFNIAWQSLLQDGSIDGIYVRRFSADGVALSGDRQANVQTLGAQSFPALATTANGQTLVVWQSEDQDHGLEIRGRLFNASTFPVGSEMELNTVEAGQQTEPDVSSVEGGFLVAWQSTRSMGDDDQGYSIQVRAVDERGRASAPEMQLNLSTETNQKYVAIAGYGRTVAAVWESQHLPGTDEDVFVFEDRRAYVNSLTKR